MVNDLNIDMSLLWDWLLHQLASASILHEANAISVVSCNVCVKHAVDIHLVGVQLRDRNGHGL